MAAADGRVTLSGATKGVDPETDTARTGTIGTAEDFCGDIICRGSDGSPTTKYGIKCGGTSFLVACSMIARFREATSRRICSCLVFSCSVRSFIASLNVDSVIGNMAASGPKRDATVAVGTTGLEVPICGRRLSCSL